MKLAKTTVKETSFPHNLSSQAVYLLTKICQLAISLKLTKLDYF